MGLAIVKQILDSHGAQIKANSKLGEGTEMVITFPKGKAARRAIRAEAREEGDSDA